MKRLCLFAHYDKDNVIDPYVVAYIKGLKSVSDKIVFVSVSNLSDLEKQKLSSHVSQILCRENIGYDFMSWKIGMAAVDDFATYDEVLLCNDSCYGPLFPFEEIFDKAKNFKCDFWGITDSTQTAYHLQSYFILYRKSVLESIAFKDFWANIASLPTKADVVKQYEVGLTAYLHKAGFKSDCFYKIDDFIHRITLKETMQDKWRRIKRKFKPLPISRVGFEHCQEPSSRFKIKMPFSFRSFLPTHTNPSMTGWRHQIQSRCPLIKVALIRDNLVELDKREDYLKEIARHSTFDTSLIKAHFTRH